MSNKQVKFQEIVECGELNKLDKISLFLRYVKPSTRSRLQSELMASTSFGKLNSPSPDNTKSI